MKINLIYWQVVFWCIAVVRGRLQLHKPSELDAILHKGKGILKYFKYSIPISIFNYKIQNIL